MKISIFESVEIKNNKNLSEIKDKFDIVLADPPWSYKDSNTRGSASRHYHTMSLEDIISLQIPAKKHSMLFLWATSPLLPEALRVMKSWGFTYKASMVWDKLIHGLGHYARISHELLLIGKQGKFPCPAPSNRFYSVIRSKRRKHSQKPDIHYIIDRMYPAPDLRKIELFARFASKPGWTYWGNETVRYFSEELLF